MEKVKKLLQEHVDKYVRVIRDYRDKADRLTPGIYKIYFDPKNMTMGMNQGTTYLFENMLSGEFVSFPEMTESTVSYLIMSGEEASIYLHECSMRASQDKEFLSYVGSILDVKTTQCERAIQKIGRGY